VRAAAVAQGWLVIGCFAEVGEGGEDASVFALGGVELEFGKDASYGVDEALDITNAFFEEVADPLGAVPDQVQGVALS
jgi:hypothetical protein